MRDKIIYGTVRQYHIWFIFQKTYIKKQLTQERQCGNIIPVADEAAPFERAIKKISKNRLTNLYECGKIIKSLEERWFFEN